MPVYEYECLSCNQRTEKNVVHPTPPPHTVKCALCGIDANRAYGVPAISFKGTGFYTTDYKDTTAKE